MARDTKDILNEFFWKKKKNKHKIDNTMRYSPVDTKKAGYGSVMEPGTFVVSDTDEVKRRLSSNLGVQMGSNTIKSMASRSIKNFPIIVSDSVDPSSALLLKKTIEEQYAEYVNLLLSNKVIDLSDFRTGEDGNIALQALDVVDGADVKAKTMRRRAGTGDLSLDDILGNLSAFELIRNESTDLSTGNVLLDELLENAMVFDSEEKADVLIESISHFPNELITLNEDVLTENTKEWLLNTKMLRNRTFESAKRDRNIGNKQDPDWYTNALNSIELNVDRDPSFVTDSDKNREKAKRTSSINKIKEIVIDFGLFMQKGTQEVDTNSYNTINDDGTLNLVSDIVDQGVEPSFTDLTSLKRRLEKEIRNRPKPTPPKNPGSQPQSQTLKDRLTGSSGRLGDDSPGTNDRPLVSGREVLGKTKKHGSTGALDVLENSVAYFMKNESGNNEEVKKIKELYNKALFLLAANMISANEFASYLRVRLGLPVSQQVEFQLLKEYPTRKLVGDSIGHDRVLRKENIDNINRSLSLTSKVNNRILPVKVMNKTLKTALTAGSVAGGAAGGYALGTSAGLAGGAGLLATTLSPLGLAVLAGSAVGGSVALLARRLLKRRSNRKEQHKRIEPWARVDELIKKMDSNRKDAIKKYAESDVEQEDVDNALALVKRQTDKDLNYIVTRNLVTESEDYYTEEELEYLNEEVEQITEELKNDKEYQAMLFEESVLNEAIEVGKMPVHLRRINRDKSVQAIPEFGQRGAYAYGDVEYDRRNIKDRGYNTPLLLKITFKERLSDDRISDNELVAVIGILGVITRVPSEEMEVILKSNAEGGTIKGLIQGEENSLSKLIMGDTLTNMKNLKISKDVWAGLEKAANLARANSLAGRRNQVVANTHLIFSQSEIDKVKADLNVDYRLDSKLVRELMKKYSVLSVMIANDVAERVYIFDDVNARSWNVVAYDDLRGKSSGDMLGALAARINNR